MIAFIDVSGNPYEQPDKSPWTAISTICIRKRSIYEITATLHRLKKDILLNEYIEMKSTDLVNSSTLNNPLRKTTFLNETISRCVDHPDCKFAALVFMNSGKNQKSDERHLPKHYVDSLWRIEAIAREWRAKDIIVVIDNNARRTDRNLAFAFNNYIYRSNGGDNLVHILPVPIFADSETTAGLQLADISAGVLRNYFSRGLNENPAKSVFDEKLVEYFDIIEKRSINRRICNFSVNGIFCPPDPYIV